MSKTGTAAADGTPVFGMLLILLVILKLAGVIHWSWWVVTAPLWLPYLILCGVMVLLVVGSVVVVVAAYIRSKFRQKGV